MPNLETLKELVSRIGEASVRMSQSRQMEDMLQGALDSARTLTGARYGVILLVDDQQKLVDFLCSGMTPEQAEEFWKMPEGWDLFEFLFGIEEPLRLRNLQGYLKENGLPAFRPPVPLDAATTFLAVPIRYREQRVGAVYLAEKEEGFSAEDEEILLAFTSQAALAITDIRRFGEEQQARTDLETLVNTVPIAVVLFDAKAGEVRSVNQEVRRLMGDLDMSIDSLQDLIVSGRFRRADGRVISQKGFSLDQVLNSGETVRGEEMIIEFADGQNFVVSVNATPVHSSDGAVESVVVAVQDVEPLAELERQRTEFLGIIGHELRSPLAAIKGSAAALLQDHSSLDPAEMVEYYRIIDEQTDHMRDLINDISDMARIETGTLSVNPEPLEPSRLVDEARNSFLNAGGRDKIRLNLSPDLPPVMADRRRVVQVIDNLLVNASRNSHETSAISVDAQLQDIHVVISVADSGRGFEAERIPFLFEKFSQSEGLEQGRNLGLGLAISKGIVEAHGGRIWAESDGPGLGSRFTFTIPTSEGKAPQASPRRIEATPRPRRTVSSELTRVLAVDDDPRVLKHVRDSLAKAGYEPVVTGNPDELAALIEEADPQVVLLDLMLPGKDGIELMRDVLAAHNIPVIFLSGYDQDELIARAFEMGAVDYIVKPFSPTELAARVRAALRKRPEQPESFTLGDLSINFSDHVVTLAGRQVDLTPTEYRLLAELAANAGVAQTHSHLLKRVWGPDLTDDARRMRTVVKDLRKKLGDNARNPRYIVTMPHIGYRMPKVKASVPAEP